MKKQRFIKNLLATAAVAAIGVSASQALGAARETTADPAVFSTGAGFDQGGAVVVDGDSIKYGAPGTVQANIAPVGGNDFSISGIDVNKQVGAKLQVDQNLKVTGNIGGATAPDFLAVVVGANNVLTISGGADFSGLGKITFNNAASIVDFATVGAIYDNVTFATNAAGRGQINISADSTFGGVTFDVRVNSMKVAYGKSAKFTFADANGLQLNQGVNLGANSTITLDSTNAAVPVNALIDGKAAGNGSVVLTGVNAFTVQKNIGAGNTVASVDMTGAAGGVTIANGKAISTEGTGINLGTRTLTLAAASKLNGATEADALNITGVGKVVVNGDATVDMKGGVKGGAATAFSIGNATLTLGANTTTVDGGVQFTDANSILVLNGNKLLKPIVANAAGQGQIQVNAGDNVLSKVGTQALPIGQIQFAADNAAVYLGSDVFGVAKANVVDFNNKNSSVVVKDGVNIKGGIDSTAGKNGTVLFAGGSIVDNAAGTGVVIGGANAVTLAFGANQGGVDVIKTASGFNAADAGVVTLNLNGDSKFGSVFNKDFTVKLNGIGGDAVVIGDIEVATDGSKSLGTIETNVAAGKMLALSGAIGDKNTQLAPFGEALKVVKATSGNLGLSAGVGKTQYIETIDLSASSDTVLKFGKGTYVAGITGKGNRVEFTGDATFGDVNTGVNWSASGVDKYAMAEATTITFTGPNTSITAANGFINTDAAGGNLVFNDAKNAVVDATIGTSDVKYNSLKLTGATSLELKKPAYFGGAIQLDDGSKLTLSDAVVATSVNGIAASKGTLVLNAVKKYDFNVGAGNAIAELQVVSGATELTGTLKANKLTFTGSDDSTFTLSKIGADLEGVAVATNTANVGSISVTSPAVAFNIDKAIGTAELPVKGIYFGGNTNIALGADVYGALTTTANDVNITLGNGATNVTTIGSSTSNFSNVTFNNSAKVTSVYAQKIQINNAKTATIKDVNAKTVVLSGANATLALVDGATLASAVVPVADSNGIVNFAGSATLKQDIGTSAARVSAVNLNGNNAILTLTGNVYTSAMATSAQTIKVTNSEVIDVTNGIQSKGSTYDVSSGETLTLKGASNLSDSTFTLGTGVVKFSDGNHTVTGATTISLTADDSSGTVKYGQIKVSDNGKLDLSGATSVTLNFIDNVSMVFAPDEGRKYYVFDAATDKITLPTNVTFSAVDNNLPAFSKWDYDSKTGVITETDQSLATATGLIPNTVIIPADQLQAIFTAPANTDLGKVRSSLVAISRDPNKKEQFAEAIARLLNPDSHSQAVANQVIESTINHVITRVDTLRAATNIASASGVAAGDVATYGAWFSPFYGYSSQELKNNVAGYTANRYGALVGLDTAISDSFDFGAALGYVRTNVKHKNLKDRDTTRSNNFLISIYGSYSFMPEWFVEGAASLGINSVSSREKRIADTGDQFAIGKYRSNNYAVEGLVGYNGRFATSGFVTPMLGLSYSRAAGAEYKETGTSFQNLSRTTKDVNKVEAIAGVKVGSSLDVMNGITFVPEVHGFVRHALKNDKPVTTATLGGGLKVTSSATVQSDTVYNMGVGVTADMGGMTQVSACYDLDLADKYTSHQGTVKVRVRF